MFEYIEISLYIVGFFSKKDVIKSTEKNTEYGGTRGELIRN